MVLSLFNTPNWNTPRATFTNRLFPGNPFIVGQRGIADWCAISRVLLSNMVAVHSSDWIVFGLSQPLFHLDLGISPPSTALPCWMVHSQASLKTPAWFRQGYLARFSCFPLKHGTETILIPHKIIGFKNATTKKRLKKGPERHPRSSKLPANPFPEPCTFTGSLSDASVGTKVSGTVSVGSFSTIFLETFPAVPPNSP